MLSTRLFILRSQYILEDEQPQTPNPPGPQSAVSFPFWFTCYLLQLRCAKLPGRKSFTRFILIVGVIRIPCFWAGYENTTMVGMCGKGESLWLTRNQIEGSHKKKEFWHCAHFITSFLLLCPGFQPMVWHHPHGPQEDSSQTHPEMFLSLLGNSKQSHHREVDLININSIVTMNTVDGTPLDTGLWIFFWA